MPMVSRDATKRFNNLDVLHERLESIKGLPPVMAHVDNYAKTKGLSVTLHDRLEMTITQEGAELYVMFWDQEGNEVSGYETPVFPATLLGAECCAFYVDGIALGMFRLPKEQPPAHSEDDGIQS